MTPQNYNWLIHTMLSFHTRKVLAQQAKKRENEKKKNNGGDSDNDEAE
jgi:hypothetical protein